MKQELLDKDVVLAAAENHPHLTRYYEFLTCAVWGEVVALLIKLGYYREKPTEALGETIDQAAFHRWLRQALVTEKSHLVCQVVFMTVKAWYSDWVREDKGVSEKVLSGEAFRSPSQSARSYDDEPSWVQQEILRQIVIYYVLRQPPNSPSDLA